MIGNCISSLHAEKACMANTEVEFNAMFACQDLTSDISILAPRCNDSPASFDSQVEGNGKYHAHLLSLALR